MSNCKHEKTTIDCVCLDCGYDLIVDARYDKIRKEERKRFIKLVKKLGHGGMTHSPYCTMEHVLAERLIAALQGERSVSE